MMKKSVLTEIRKFLKLFPGTKSLYQVRLSFPEFLEDESCFDVTIRRGPGKQEEVFRVSFNVCSVRKYSTGGRKIL